MDTPGQHTVRSAGLDVKDREDPRSKMRIVEPDDRPGKLKRFVITLLILTVLVLVTFFFVARTDGFRSLFERAVERRLGIKLTIKDVHIGLPYMIVAENVESEGGSEDQIWKMKIEELRVGLTFFAKMRVVVKRCELILLQDADGSWAPTVFSRLGDLPVGNIADISEATAGFRKRIELEITDSSITWLPHDAEKAVARGVFFSVQPVKMPTGRMYYHTLRVYNVLAVDAQSGRTMVHNIEREWLADTRTLYVGTRKSGDIPPGAEAFWDPTAE